MTYLFSVMPWRSGASLLRQIQQRVDVVVLAIEVDSLLGDYVADVLSDPFQGLGVAEVQQRAAEQPVVLVVVVEPRARCDPLGLEPDDDLDAFGMCVIADRPQAAGESRRIDLPRAGLRPVSIAGIPAGVHPPVVDLDSLGEVAIDEQFLAGLVGLGHFGELVGTARRHLRGGQFAAGPRQVVGEHPAPP